MRYHENGSTYLDYFTIRKELNVCESKLIRTLKKLNIEVYKYKHQNLINEKHITLIENSILKNNSND